MILNNYSEFQVNIFSNNRDIRLHLENSKSKKGHSFVKNGGLLPLLVWVSLLMVNNYSEFQVNIFSNNRDLKKMSKFSHDGGRRRRKGYDNTSTFSSKTAELIKMNRKLVTAKSVCYIFLKILIRFH